MSSKSITWTVSMSGKVHKAKDTLPPEIKIIFLALAKSLGTDGPIQSRRRNFGKIEGKKDTWHCHLNSGRPTYVVV